MTKPPPKWVGFLRDQLRQTSTRSGLFFLIVSGAGWQLTEEHATAIMAAAGFASALFSLLYPDRRE